MNNPVLQIQNISYQIESKKILSDISFEINAGEIVCLVGPSGSGKTTILRLIAGLDPVQKGTLRLNNRYITHLPPEKRSIGLVFQDYALFPHLDVKENVGFGLRNKKIKRAGKQKRVTEILQHVDMEQYMTRYPHMLSGGQQQRVALARALATRPSIMLLDEPFAGLDNRLRTEIRDQTLHILKQSDSAALFVTHDPEEAMFLADRIILIKEGKIVQIGTPEDLYNRPVNNFAAGFFDEINILKGTVKKGIIKTALGHFNADHLDEGQEIEILVRPEHLALSDPVPKKRASPIATVLAARFLGRASLIHLSIKGQKNQEELHLHARAPGYFLPKEGAKLVLHVDSDKVFLFPL